ETTSMPAMPFRWNAWQTSRSRFASIAKGRSFTLRMRERAAAGGASASRATPQTSRRKVAAMISPLGLQNYVARVRLSMESRSPGRGISRPAPADRRRQESRVERAEAERVRHGGHVGEAGARERPEPVLGGEEAGGRPRLAGEGHDREAPEERERQLGADRAGGSRTEALAADEPAAGRERRV